MRFFYTNSIIYIRNADICIVHGINFCSGMKEGIKNKVLRGFEGLLKRVGLMSYISLSSFLFGCIALMAMPNIYREAVIGGLIIVGASLILLKAFIVKK